MVILPTSLTVGAMGRLGRLETEQVFWYSSVSLLFPLKSASQFGCVAPSSLWAGVGACHTCEEGTRQYSAI